MPPRSEGAQPRAQRPAEEVAVLHEVPAPHVVAVHRAPPHDPLGRHAQAPLPAVLPRHAALAAVRDAVALVDEHGAMPRDVVIVAMDPKSALAAARAAVVARVGSRFTRRAKDPSCPPDGQIRILQVSECRGHDFPVVLLVGIERLADGAAERTLFYRAATRAQHLLMAYGVGGKGLSDEVAECALRCVARD